MKAILRLFAFFGKEIHEIRRQPRLVLSLILGPFLILLAFGVGYMNQRPPLRVSLVIPQEVQNDPRMQAIQELVQKNFNLVGTYSDMNQATADLNSGRAEAVEVFPPDTLQKMEAGEQVQMDFVYNEIDPQKIQYYEYIGYLQTEAINTSLLLNSISQLQGDVSNARQQISDVRGQLSKINSAMSAQDISRTRDLLHGLDTSLTILSASPAAYAALAYQQGQSGTDGSTNLLQARQDIHDLDASLEAGQFEQQQQRIQDLDQRLGDMDERLGRLENANPTAVVAPVEQNYKNLRGKPVDLMVFFAPSVLALILQHIAITLGALSLVRERVRGALEFFGVAPVSMIQVLLGKYLAYVLFLGIIAAILIALLVFALGVPFAGSLGALILFLLLYLIACIGIGFFVSVISTSETQAIQISMLFLLLSIFFSGFVLPLEYFRPAVALISYILPVTHGSSGFRSIMLLGHLVNPVAAMSLAIIASVTFLLVVFLWGRLFRRLA
jgi:ABC-2 type transport system permease protein